MPVGLYAGANVSIGNGATLAFPYNFKLLDQTHLEVKVDGALKVLGADYTVTGVGLSNGGNVNFIVAPANGAVVQRARKVPIKRDQDYQNNGDFKEITVDNDFDSIEMQVQQIAADVARAFKAPLSVTTDQVFTDADWAARAGKFVRYKNDGTNVEFVSVSPDLSTFTATGVGALPRSWSGKVGERVSVKDFGAQGDGVTDDTAAIVAAHNASKHVFYPLGTYLVSGTNNLCTYQNVDDITLEFENATIKYNPAQAFVYPTTWDMFAFKSCERVAIRGVVKLQGNLSQADIKAAAFPYGPKGFHFYHKAKNVSIDVVEGNGIQIPVFFERMQSLKASGVAGIGAGGAGYTVNDILTVQGGTPNISAQVKVLAVDGGGAVTNSSIQTAGLYRYTDAVGGYGITIPVVADADDGVAVAGGTGANAKFNLFWDDADVTTRAENVDIALVNAENCMYPCEFLNTGFGVRIGECRSDFTSRSLILIGAENVRANVTFRHHTGDAIALSCLNGQGLSNVHLNVHFLPASTANWNGGSMARFNWSGNHPGKFKDVHLHMNGDYGALAGRGGLLVEIEKESAKGRGRRFEGFSLTGRVDGTPDQDTGAGLGNIVATNTTFSWANAPLDLFSYFKAHPFINNSGLAFAIDQNVIGDTMPAVQFETLPSAVAGSPTFYGNLQVGSGGSGSLTMGRTFRLKRTAPAYGPNVAIDANLGNEYDVVANNGVAFNVNNPTNPIDGQRITVTVKNTSGGALGAVTWAAKYKLSAWVSPANGQNRSIDFVYDQTNDVWREASRTPADVPN